MTPNLRRFFTADEDELLDAMSDINWGWADRTRTMPPCLPGRGQDRAGGQVMDKQIIERAVEAAAKAMSEHWRDMHTNESLGHQRMLAQHAVTAALAEVEGSLTAERDRLAERIDTLLGVADEDGVTYPPNEFQRALRRYAAFEYDNLVAERDDLAAYIDRARKLAVEWYTRAEFSESLGRTKDAWWRGFTIRQREAADELLAVLRGESE